jgi:hypothetical protein
MELGGGVDFDDEIQSPSLKPDQQTGFFVETEIVRMDIRERGETRA